jgi:hypothetical protein
VCARTISSTVTSAKPSLPADIQALVDNFATLFLPPTGLPPKRASEHTIPLLPGAQPFRLRTYRYNSAQKDEIERQVQQLLANGWIRESNYHVGSVSVTNNTTIIFRNYYYYYYYYLRDVN